MFDKLKTDIYVLFYVETYSPDRHCSGLLYKEAPLPLSFLTSGTLMMTSHSSLVSSSPKSTNSGEYLKREPVIPLDLKKISETMDYHQGVYLYAVSQHYLFITQAIRLVEHIIILTPFEECFKNMLRYQGPMSH